MGRLAYFGSFEELIRKLFLVNAVGIIGKVERRLCLVLAERQESEMWQDREKPTGCTPWALIGVTRIAQSIVARRRLLVTTLV